jgi:hypothetical protein
MHFTLDVTDHGIINVKELTGLQTMKLKPMNNT